MSLGTGAAVVVVSEVVVAGVLELPPLAGVAEVAGVAAGLTSPAPRSPAEPELEQPAMDRQAQTPTASSQNRFPEADRSIVITVSLRTSSSFWDVQPAEAGRSCPCLSGHTECADDDTVATFLANRGFSAGGDHAGQCGRPGKIEGRYRMARCPPNSEHGGLPLGNREDLRVRAAAA